MSGTTAGVGEMGSTGRVRGRYAPSPTGDLHLGNLRTALLAWLAARAVGGAFILRVEDLDLPRVRPGATGRMLADLHWLGLDWDEGPEVGGPFGPYVQSQRTALYAAAVAYLRARELVYPCYCTRAELAREAARIASVDTIDDSDDIASAPHDEHAAEAPYPGTCRDLTPAQRRRREAEGRRPALRFRAPTVPITFTDVLAGPRVENVAESVGDFIVRRSDGVFAYQLAVVVDDALMGITQVVRGADLLGSTARQLALYDALGYPRPVEYLHVPLVLDAAGQRLAKRDAAAGLARPRARGLTREEILGALAASGGFWHSAMPATLADLLAAYAPPRLARQPTRLPASLA